MPYIPNPATGEQILVTQTEYDSWVTKVTSRDSLSSPVITTEESQSTSDQTPPGPIAYQPPPTSIQTFDDGSTLQTFDDGSTLATSTDGALSSSNATEDITAPSSLGFGAANDDSGVPTVSSINATINAVSVGPIVSQPNVLDQYASYTYSLGLYLITPDQFNDLKNGPPNFAEWTLLIQSGGALTTPNQSALGQRSPFFKLDYYLDNLNLLSRLPGGGPGTLTAHNVTELDFNIYEPNGISLINNLAQAVQNLYKQSPAAGSATNGATTTVPGQAGTGPTTTGGVPLTVSYMQTPYVMVIRFYGYDDQGNLLQAGNPSKAIVTKYYPFAISKIDFKLQSKAIEYKVTGKVLIYDLAPSAKRGSIPANINLVGKTINDILNGNNSAGIEVSPADGRSSSSTPSVQKAPPAPAPKHDIQSTIGISGIHAGTPGAENQQQADTLNLLLAGNMGA
jgi:hypothetical protein